MKGDVFMALAIVASIGSLYLTITHFIGGNYDAGAGWLCALLWSVNAIIYELRLRTFRSPSV